MIGNVPLMRNKMTETTALGAAYAAGIAAGYWENTDELRSNMYIDKTWHPQLDEQHREMLFNNWKRAVQRTLNWLE